MDAMYKEARALRAIPMKGPLNGWGIDAKIATVVNYVPRAYDKILLKARNERDE